MAALGCAGGVAVGYLADRAIGAINLRVGIPILLDFQLSWRVLLYAVSAALLTGLAVSIVPALRASRINLNDVLHQGGRSATAGRQRVRAALVVVEVGGSLMLLIVAGLFIRSLGMVQHVDLGFDPSHVLNLSMDPHDAGYSDAQGSQLFHELLERVQNVPGVESATIAASVPMDLTTMAVG